MTSEVDICNMALRKLGAEPITSIDNPTTEVGELCQLNFDLARDCVLEEHTWNFALRRAVLDPTGNDPAWGDDVEHQIPQGVIAIARCYRSQNTRDLLPAENWRRSGAYVYANSSPLYAEVIERVEDLSRWPGLCRAALAVRLAAELAVPVTHDVELEQKLWQEYAVKIREAAASDGLQARREVFNTRRLTGVRAKA